MFKDKLYTVLGSESEGQSVKARISFDRSHPIFDGHFPGHPVVPGVCMMQILKEVMEDHTTQKLQITNGDNMKFLAIINPDENKEVNVDISYTDSEGRYLVTGSLQAGPVTFFKFKGTFQKYDA